jgi:hypothetical protein
MPFAGYADFAACVAANSDKDDPAAYCGVIKAKVEKTRQAFLKHPGPDGSEVHGTGSDQLIHGQGRGFHGTIRWEDVIASGFKLSDPVNGRLFGDGAYLAATYDQADQWTWDRGEVLVTELPTDLKTLVIRTDVGPGSIAQWWWEAEYADRWVEERIEAEGRKADDSWWRRKAENGRKHIKALLDGQDSDAARQVLTEVLGPTWGGKIPPWEGKSERLQRVIEAHGYQALEIVPLLQTSYNSGSGGHQLIIYDEEVLASLRFDVAMVPALAKSATQRQWYLPIPAPVWKKLRARTALTKHLPGQHDQKTHGNRYGPSVTLRQWLGFVGPRGKTFLAHGRSYRVPTVERMRELMEQYDISPGRAKECFMNAASAVVFESSTDLRYVEGYAASIIPIHHAWLVTPNGEVIDPTWAGQISHGVTMSPGSEYFGIAFDTDWLRAHLLRTEVWGVFQGIGEAPLHEPGGLDGALA